MQSSQKRECGLVTVATWEPLLLLLPWLQAIFYNFLWNIIEPVGFLQRPVPAKKTSGRNKWKSLCCPQWEAEECRNREHRLHVECQERSWGSQSRNRCNWHLLNLWIRFTHNNGNHVSKLGLVVSKDTPFYGPEGHLFHNTYLYVAFCL